MTTQMLKSNPAGVDTGTGSSVRKGEAVHAVPLLSPISIFSSTVIRTIFLKNRRKNPCHPSADQLHSWRPSAGNYHSRSTVKNMPSRFRGHPDGGKHGSTRRGARIAGSCASRQWRMVSISKSKHRPSVQQANGQILRIFRQRDGANPQFDRLILQAEDLGKI